MIYFLKILPSRKLMLTICNLFALEKFEVLMKRLSKHINISIVQIKVKNNIKCVRQIQCDYQYKPQNKRSVQGYSLQPCLLTLLGYFSILYTPVILQFLIMNTQKLSGKCFSNCFSFVCGTKLSYRFYSCFHSKENQDCINNTRFDTMETLKIKLLTLSSYIVGQFMNALC